jgi:hypothetical protein
VAYFLSDKFKNYERISELFELVLMWNKAGVVAFTDVKELSKKLAISV